MAVDDGGPAFPLPEGQYVGEDRTDGMSLRACIATHVFAESEAAETFTSASGLELNERAVAAVRAADALIAALKEGT